MRSDDPDEPPTQPATPDANAPITLEKQSTVKYERLPGDTEVTKTLEGYMFGDVIGRGGLGEVVAAHDLRVGRDVAIKRLRTPNPTDSEVQRFLREIVGVALVLSATALSIVRRPRISMGALVVYACGNAGLMALMARVISPWTFVPAVTCIIIMSMMAYPQFASRPWLLISIFVIGFCAIVGLEVRGIIAPGWEIHDGAIVLHAMALEITSGPTLMLLFVASIATIVTAGIHAAATYRAGRSAQQQLVMQAWHLQQLLPTAR
jgi:hypothetical protein